jgi:hypothetical protein
MVSATRENGGKTHSKLGCGIAAEAGGRETRQSRYSAFTPEVPGQANREKLRGCMFMAAGPANTSRVGRPQTGPCAGCRARTSRLNYLSGKHAGNTQGSTQSEINHARKSVGLLNDSGGPGQPLEIDMYIISPCQIVNLFHYREDATSPLHTAKTMNGSRIVSLIHKHVSLEMGTDST